MALEHHNIVINNITIHYVASTLSKTNDTKASTLVFLHGFPEYWQTWQAQLNYFSKYHHVIAPDLPGYNLSDKPQYTTFYEVTNLIKVMATFIKNVSPTEKVVLVAHDWGGAIAWPLAAFYSQYIDKLVILNAAHPSTFSREMINNPLQREKSAYIHELISPQAETLLSKNNYQYLRDKIMISAKKGTFSDQTMSAYKGAWQQPGAVNGMLQYYRAMPQLAAENHYGNTRYENTRHKKAILKKVLENNIVKANLSHSSNSGATTPVKNTAEMKIPNIRINVPTLILWGEQDQAFVNENLDDIEHYVPNCKIKRFSDASHWLMHEKSPEINVAITKFIEVS